MKQISLSLIFLGLLTLLPFLSSAQIHLDSGLVAYYPFDGNANDSTGNGNNGAVFSATLTTDRFSRDRHAYEFDGINDYIDFGDAPEFRFTTDFSFSLWIYHPGFDQKGGILQKREIVNPFTLWGINTGESPQNYVESKYVFFSHREDGLDPNLGTQKFVANPNGTLSEGWHHLVVLNDISARAYLYVDNVLIDSSATVPGTGEVVGYPLLAGASNDPTLGIFNFFNGKIDDIRLYNRLFSVAEIDSLFNEMPISTSSADEQLSHSLHIFPNPTSGHFTVESSEAAIQNIRLYDLTGQEIQAQMDIQRHEARVKSDYRGITLLKIQTDQGLIMRKILFE